MFKYSIHEKINFKSNCGPKSKIKHMLNKYSEYLNEHSLQYPKSELFIRSFDIRTLFLLPTGQYKLTDRICKYTLVKYDKTDSKNYMVCTIYQGNADLGAQRISFFSDKESVFEDDSREQRKYGDPQRQSLSMLTSVGSMNVHSKDYYNCLSSLQLVQKGSFKQYVQNEIHIIDNTK